MLERLPVTTCEELRKKVGTGMKRTDQKTGAWPFRLEHRKGVFFVLAVICLMGAMTFVGMSVDLGMIAVAKTRMQAAADSAALAAAQEIVVAVRDASWDSENGLDMDAVQILLSPGHK